MKLLYLFFFFLSFGVFALEDFSKAKEKEKVDIVENTTMDREIKNEVNEAENKISGRDKKERKNEDDKLDEEILKAIKEDKLEQEIVSKKSSRPRFKQSENPDISFVMNFGLGIFTDNNHIKQLGHSIDSNGLTLQGLEMTAEHSIDPYWKFNLNFQFIGMHIEEAYITSLALPFNMQMRLGMMNALFGRENNQHLHVLHTINYSLMHSRFLSHEHFSGLGIELSYLIPLPWYSLIVAQIFDNKDAYFRSSSFGKSSFGKDGYISGFDDLVYLARLENFFDLNDSLSLYWNFSSTFGKSNLSPDDRTTLLGTDVYLKYRPFNSGNDGFMIAMTFESIFRHTQIPSSHIRDYGGYLQLDMLPNKYWSLTLRGDFNDSFSKIPKTKMYQEKFNRETRGTFAMSYMPTHFSRIRLQYDIVKKEGMDLYHAFFLQVEGNVGSHGAHNY